MTRPTPTQDEREANIATQFREFTPEYYGSDHNMHALMNYLSTNGMPFSVVSLQIAYNRLSEADELETRASVEPPDHGIIKFGVRDTAILRHTIPDSMAARQLLAEERTFPAADGRSRWHGPKENRTRATIQDVVGRGTRRKQPDPSHRIEARQWVIINHPDVKRDGAVFNTLVSQRMADDE